MNFNSLDWKELVSEIDQRISDLDKKNRGQKSEAETSHIRGQIAALLSLKDLQIAAIPTEDEVNYVI